MWSELGWSVDIDFARRLERERDEWKSKYIQQNKDLGCELRDPNGTIWDHAKTLQRERDEARAEMIRWMSIAEGRGRTDDEEESDCSVCRGCFMIAGTEPNDDVMNTPCPKCNGHSEDTEKTISNLIRERDETREQLAEIEDKMRIELRGYSDSKLWGEAGLIAATMRCVDALEEATEQRDRLAKACDQYSEDEILCKLQEITAQRDRLAEALEDIRARCKDKTIELHPDSDAKGCVDDCLEWSEQALQSLTPNAEL
jgi:hypothetical protein